MDESTAGKAAAALWELWSTGQQMPQLPDELRPANLDDGWAVQRALDRLAGPLAGWKVAASSEKAQAVIGVDGPLAGALYERQLVGDGAELPVPAIEVAEAEFVFRLGRDLPAAAAPFNRDEVLAAVASVHPAIEVPDSRLSMYPALGAPQMIADAMVGGHLVVGEPLLDIDMEKLATIEVVLHCDGDEVARGSGADVLGDPCEALVWLSNEIARRGESMRAGQVVTTGACAVRYGLDAGSRISATFGTAHASVSVVFAAASRS